jgi:single-stranded-DNA-specific exonuclease
MTRDQNSEVCLARDLQLSSIMARLLVARGVTDSEQARPYLYPEKNDFLDPFLFSDMEKAVEIIHETVVAGGGILVFGDYDVDGILSISLLRLAFSEMGYNLSYRIPDRVNEGYGLNRDDIISARDSGVELIITVDCGSSNVDEVLFAKSLGIRVIITDHHEVSGPVPQADAFLNPKAPESSYPFKTLAGVGVAFKLLCGYCARKAPEIDPFRWLDLVALATVADIVPLDGENRTIVSLGMNDVNSTGNIGLQTLIDKVGLKGRLISPGHISFTIAPKINAAGRVGDPGNAVELFCSADPSSAIKYAANLMEANQHRQKVEKDILARAEELLSSLDSKADDDVIVLDFEGWNLGVIGIVASLLKDRHHCPVILIGKDGDRARGSGRSIEGFSLYDALASLPDDMLQFGGHDLAVGLSMESRRIPEMKRALSEIWRHRMDPVMKEKRLHIDMELCFSDIDAKLVEDLGLLRPFGPRNRPPVFVARDCSIIKHRRVGYRRNHLWFIAGQGKHVFEGIGFNLGPLEENLISPAQTVDLAFDIGMNENRKGRYIQLKLKDLMVSDARFFGELFREDGGEDDN